MSDRITTRHRIISAADTSELDQIYRLGCDTWADGASEDQFLENCRASEKYRKGSWHALALGDEIVSALILYADAFSLPAKAVGIGSVATLPKFRKKGYATELLQTVISKQLLSGVASLYLFADLDTTLYERLGFKSTGRASEPGCMVRHIGTEHAPASASIEYF